MIKLTKGQKEAIRYLRNNLNARIYYEKELFAFYSCIKEKPLLNIQTAKLLKQSGLIEIDNSDSSLYKLSRVGRNISLYSI
jgi:hypothetical protein